MDASIQPVLQLLPALIPVTPLGGIRGQATVGGLTIAGMAAERGLARAAEVAACLAASVLLGGTAFTTGAARLGVALTRLRPKDALNARRAGCMGLDGMIGLHRRGKDAPVASRLAEPEAQGYGPQRVLSQTLVLDRSVLKE